jgi:predicted ATP-grasp superfamily ATP-dependent carboligase
MSEGTRMPSEPSPYLRINRDAPAPGGTMLIALAGWMDGGDVSTGTVRRMIELLDASPVADIDPEDFYVLQVPGNMEVNALFRPEIDVAEGELRSIDLPSATFYHAGKPRVTLLLAREPNLRWRAFADAVFEMARRSGVKTLIFVGSFGGLVPHTREPRLYVTVSNPDRLADYTRFGLAPSKYEGPGSFATYLLSRADSEGFDMASIAVEVPGYLQGLNPSSIEAVTRRLAKILALDLDLEELRTASTQWELKVSEAVEQDDDLAEKVRELEKQYDDALIEAQAEKDES